MKSALQSATKRASWISRYSIARVALLYPPPLQATPLGLQAMGLWKEVAEPPPPPPPTHTYTQPRKQVVTSRHTILQQRLQA